MSLSISSLAIALTTALPPPAVPPVPYLDETSPIAQADPAGPIELPSPEFGPPPSEEALAEAPPADALPPPTIEAEPPSDGPADIVVTARQEVPGDPLANLNVQSYEVIQGLDEAVVAPIATGYSLIVPKPVRQGLRNFLRNLEEPIIALNYMLQLKPGRALRSIARFTVNTALGIGGLFDVAKTKSFNMPYTPNSFGNTFACWGIGPGPYFFLPLIGPTTLRDVIGVSLDRAALPAIVGKPFDQPYYAIPANVIDSINDRIEIDGQLERIRTEEADPYAATRDLYLKQRRSEIAAICPKAGEQVDPTLPPRAGKGRD